MTWATEIVNEMDTREEPPIVPDVARVLKIWTCAFRVHIDDVCGPSRSRRHMACRAAITHDLYASGWFTLSEIGQLLGGRNHSTVCHMLAAYRPGGRRRNARLPGEGRHDQPAGCVNLP